MRSSSGIFATVLIVAATALAATPPSAKDIEWPVYGGDPGGSKYSSASQIDRSNVAGLKVAWVYHTKDMYTPPPHHGGKKSAFESTPLFVDGVLYVTTAFGRIIALDPATGKEKWAFDSHSDISAGWGDFANRGAATWVDPASKRRKLYIATVDARLACVEAEDGSACNSFGDRGVIDLRTGLRNPPNGKWEYEETSPPAVINDLVVVGSAIADNSYSQSASGEVRAFDTRTGKLRWTWDPMPGQKTGAANAWSIISVDPERNLVFLPTGSASPDYFGGLREGDDLYANSVVALNAENGRRVWHFQTVHHDLWDYDVASQPALITIRQDGRDRPVVAAGSKTGNLFVLDRATGKPVWGVEERPVPKSDVPGEKASPTQPFPVLPKPLVSQAPVGPDDVWGLSDADRKYCQAVFQKNRSEGIFTPPTIKGSLFRPGNIGGQHWGGVAFDPDRNLLIVPSNEFIAEMRLIPREQFDEQEGKEPGWEYARQRGTPFGLMRRFVFAPSGMPCGKPPFGTLTALDMATGEVRWKVPLGSLPNVPTQVGAPNLGGPIVTAGGLIFMAGTVDGYFRAFDTDSGKELWKSRLPAAGRATPMTYQAAGKQYVVIAAGGFESLGETNDSLVAFALP